jgi:hypothetical protein
VERFARKELLGDLPFEFDVMGAVLGHGFHPLKARHLRSIPNLGSVHRQGRTPLPVYPANHDDGNMPEAIARLYLRKHLVAVHVRHGHRQGRTPD